MITPIYVAAAVSVVDCYEPISEPPVPVYITHIYIDARGLVRT